MRVLKHRKTLGSRLTRRHAINAEREQLPVTKGDTVRVMRGEDKGKEQRDPKSHRLHDTASVSNTLPVSNTVRPRKRFPRFFGNRHNFAAVTAAAK